MVSRAEKLHVTPLFLCFALSRSPFGTKNDHRRARCAVGQQSQNMTLTQAVQQSKMNHHELRNLYT
jgi:hypothetical protein